MSEQTPEQYASTKVVPDNPPYGGPEDQSRAHMLEQYKHFVDVTIQYWNHIGSANQFFLSLHVVILSGFTYLLTSRARIPLLLLVALTLLASGIALHWWILLRSLRRLNQVRHEIIQEWETHLPAHPYRVEYYKLYVQDPSRYFGIQKLYTLLPVLVLLTYLGLALAIALDVRLVNP